MKSKILILILIIFSFLIAEDNVVVNTESLFMDPSLSLDKKYDFVKFQYLSQVSKFIAPKLNGGIFKLSDYVGDLKTNLKLKRYYERYQDDPRKTLIVSFFASYCEPCKEEIPELLEVTSSLYSERNDIMLVLIGMDGKREVLNKFLSSNDFELPENAVVLLNPPRNKLSPSSIMNVEKLPSMFIINREGEIILEHHGYKKDTNIQLLVENIINYYEGIEKYNK